MFGDHQRSLRIEDESQLGVVIVIASGAAVARGFMQDHGKNPGVVGPGLKRGGHRLSFVGPIVDLFA